MRAYTNPANQSQKMLASTVQFSTYDQTPPPRPRQTPDSPQGTRRYEKQNGPDMSSRSPAPSGPNSVPTTRPHRQTPVHPPPIRRPDMQYWEPAPRAGRTGQRSTLEHHPTHTRPIEMTDRPGVGAALHHTRQGVR